MKMSGDFSSFMRELNRANIHNTTTLFNGLQQQRKDDMAGLNNIPAVYVSKLSFKAQSGRLSLCVLQLIAKHRSTGRFASICALKHVHTDVHYSTTYSTDARLLRTSSQDILVGLTSPTDALATDALAARSTSS